MIVRAPDLFRWLGADSTVETDQAGSQRQVLLLLFGGILAAVTALLSWKRHGREQQALQIERDRHWTSRYTEAVSQLGDPSNTLNYGGLYALQRLAIEAREAEDAQMITNLLSSYIRDQAALRDAPTSDEDAPKRVPPQILIDTFRALSQVSGHHEISGDFRGSNLQKLNVSSLTLPRSLFSNCHLGDASFYKAELPESRFLYSYMRGATLQGCQLIDSNFHKADLRGAILKGASLEGCLLHGVDLSGADLRGTILTGAKGFRGKQLEAAAKWDTDTVWPEGHRPSTPEKGVSGGVVTVVRDK
nr:MULTISPECIES: pentapeptide repeat-containing protein [unclassified Nesterenkonia]